MARPDFTGLLNLSQVLITQKYWNNLKQNQLTQKNWMPLRILYREPAPSNTPTTAGYGADNKKRDREGIIDHEYSHTSSTLLGIECALDCL